MSFHISVWKVSPVFNYMIIFAILHNCIGRVSIFTIIWGYLLFFTNIWEHFPFLQVYGKICLLENVFLQLYGIFAIWDDFSFSTIKLEDLPFFTIKYGNISLFTNIHEDLPFFTIKWEMFSLYTVKWEDLPFFIIVWKIFPFYNNMGRYCHPYNYMELFSLFLQIYGAICPSSQ